MSWDYGKSVKRIRTLVKKYRCKEITDNQYTELLRELYLTREFLTSQKKYLRETNSELSWSGYCKEIGILYQTVNNWLRPFTPITKIEKFRKRVRRGVLNELAEKTKGGAA